MRIEEQAFGDEGAWHQYAQECAQRLLSDERAALHRVAQNDSLSDAALLARSLGHNDLAEQWGKHESF